MPPIHDLAGPAGPLEALLDEPSAQPRALVIFAHPLPTHGGTMHTKAVFQGAKGLVRIGCAVLRFNFRGVGRSQGTFDAGPGEIEDFRARIAHYERVYEPLDDSDGSYIKIIDVGQKVVLHKMLGYLPGRLVPLLINLHITPR